MGEINLKIPSLADFPFHYRLQTRWKDLDSFGHVNNAVFLTYFEDARIDFFKRWKISTQKESLIMASIKLDYLRQMSHPLSLVIGQKISRIGNTSFDINASLFAEKDTNPFAVTTIICVCFNYEKNTAVPVFDMIKADFKVSTEHDKT